MYCPEQIERMLGKVKRFENTLKEMIFTPIEHIELKAYPTSEWLTAIPDESLFFDVDNSFKWGGELNYCWFKCKYTIPGELEGQNVYFMPNIGCYEGLIWVNGVPYGNLASKIVWTSHGNHYCGLIRKNAKAGEVIDITVEYYAGHYCPGTSPFETNAKSDYMHGYGGADICVKNAEIADFYFDLYTVNRLASSVYPKDSFYRGKVINALSKVHETVYYSKDDIDDETFISAIREVAPVLKEVLSYKSDDCAPTGVIVGHSHMDTAWLWHVGETVKKCARTYANQIALMDEYPEYRFVQSSACHSDFLRRHYPDLFARLQEKIAEGRYEPNGGVWVECDCNITSGEAMVRQFLWGQRFTRKYFNYTSNCFWLPDTFGYSAAIPQIMKGCSVDYFLTTKISWNDTNKFPYDTFVWEGIDGTRVFSHFNTTHHFPDAENVASRLAGVKQKSVTDKRLLAFGYGDGGGGPMFEEIELSRRCKDLAGVGKTKFMAVGDFMKELEKEVVNPNTYKGELYLELHRGTLTNQHTIKRNNRKSENALHNLEFLTVSNALAGKTAAVQEKINELWKVLLINQFHDILPGTCINRAHVQSREQTNKLLADAKAMQAELTKGECGDFVTFTNPCSFDRCDAVFMPYDGKIIDGDYAQQLYTDLDGEEKLIVLGVNVPAFSSVTLPVKSGKPEGKAVLTIADGTIDTAFATIKLADDMTVSSYVLKADGREVKAADGENLGSYIMAEDVPTSWDNWDIDADVEAKFKNVSKLVSSEVVSEGAAALIVRNVYEISAKSKVTQDMMIFADSPEIRYDIAMDWQDNHRLLKVAFDTTAYEEFARQEIQFGYAKRPTTRNNSIEQAKFETLNHKYSDISESRFGVAVLNDCKYGVSVKGGSIRLSLHKGGNRPDYMGDHDCIHRAAYALLPHDCGFGVQSVTKPAYLLNNPVIVSCGKFEAVCPVKVDADNIVIETIKPCEDSEKAFIVRMYEAEGTRAVAKLTLPDGAAAKVTNMLEEVISDADDTLVFRPFEIKTLKVSY